MEAQETPEGLIVPVNVRPGAPNFRLHKEGHRLLLEVTSPPREGQANQEIVRELPRLLRCEVRILGGMRSRRKLLLLRGMAGKDLKAFLESH
jgi:uncharacterized protein (TIGR00251 family)